MIWGNCVRNKLLIINWFREGGGGQIKTESHGHILIFVKGSLLAILQIPFQTGNQFISCIIAANFNDAVLQLFASGSFTIIKITFHCSFALSNSIDHLPRPIPISLNSNFNQFTRNSFRFFVRCIYRVFNWCCSSANERNIYNTVQSFMYAYSSPSGATVNKR